MARVPRAACCSSVESLLLVLGWEAWASRSRTAAAAAAGAVEAVAAAAVAAASAVRPQRQGTDGRADASEQRQLGPAVAHC